MVNLTFSPRFLVMRECTSSILRNTRLHLQTCSNSTSFVAGNWRTDLRAWLIRCCSPELLVDRTASRQVHALCIARKRRLARRVCCGGNMFERVHRLSRDRGVLEHVSTPCRCVFGDNVRQSERAFLDTNLLLGRPFVGTVAKRWSRHSLEEASSIPPIAQVRG